MKVLANNCVSKIKIPNDVESANGVDYNPVLDLYATFNHDDGVSVWSPVSRKVKAEFEFSSEEFQDLLFLPGDRIGLSSAEGHHGGSIQFFSLEKDKSDSAELEIIEDLPMTYPGALALSPERNLLVTDSYNGGEGVYEICMDWYNLKVLKFRNIIPGDEDDESGIGLLCCSPDFKVITAYGTESTTLSSAKVCFNSEGEVEIKEQSTITYYMLDGEEKYMDVPLPGFVHDGKNLIIANEDEIVLLESITEGSNAHLIASDVEPSGQVRLNHKGQLMVCEDKAIKLFEYHCNPRSLQDTCRCRVRKTICTGLYSVKVNSLAIPSILKKYLLYK